MKTLTIKARLILLIIVFLVSLAVVFLVSITNMNKMMDNSTSIYKLRLTGIQSLVEADRDAYQSLSAINLLFLNEDDSKVAGYITEVEENLQQVDDRFHRFLDAFKESDSEQQSELEEIFELGFADLKATSTEMVGHLSDRNLEQAREDYYENYLPKFQIVRNVLDEYTNISSEDAAKEYELITIAQQKGLITLIIIFVVLVISLIIAGYFFVQSITVPLNKGITLAREIAKGNLLARIDKISKDEIGQLNSALMEMVKKLSDIINNIVMGSDNLAKAGNEISSTSQQISQGANEQAASVEEVSSTMEQIASNIQSNTENAQQTEKISNEANDGMKEVEKRSKETAEANQNISEKITIINDIAFQTNILALNAAVEAARAGEHGKGFAVVAAEVRKLAERSKVAADEIVGLADKSLHYAQSAGEVMLNTIPKIENTTKLIQEISASSIEQNNGAGQVNNAIQQLSSVSQQNAASSEELATSAEELNSQAEELKELVSFFNIGHSNQQGKFRRKSYMPNGQIGKESVMAKSSGGANISLVEDDSKTDSEFEKF